MDWIKVQEMTDLLALGFLCLTIGLSALINRRQTPVISPFYVRVLHASNASGRRVNRPTGPRGGDL